MSEPIRKYRRTIISALLAVALSIWAAPVVMGSVAVSKTAKEKLQTKITYSCVDSPIETVLMQLAEKAGVDIVKSPKVTGNVTAKLTDVPLEEALTNILAAYDYTFIATDNMIRVVPVAEVTLATEELISKVYRITYADANEVAVALRNFVSERGRVALNKGTRHIVVTDTARKIKAIDKFIEELDRETPQVLVEVRIYDITTKEGFELETAWRAARNAPVKTTQHTSKRINTDFPTSLTETTTTVIGPSSTSRSENTSGSGTTSENRTVNTVSGENSSSSTTSSGNTTNTTNSTDTTTGNYRDAGDGSGSFTTIGTSTQNKTESSSTTGSQSTSGWTTENRTDNSNTTSGQTTEGGTSDSGRTDTETKVTGLPVGTFYDTTTETYTTRRRKPFVGGSFNRVEGGTLNFSILNDAVDLDLALNILSTQVESKLLANPRILVVDNEKADFQIIREVPYTELTQTGRGQMITSTVFKPVGIKLEVTPHVTREGVIRLHILPEFSILVSQNANGVPTVDTRKADTITLVKDGQTVAIGGLRRRQTSRNISKVPVLGDMPLVGGLFQSETESVEINELIVFITPKIIGQPETLETETADSHTMEISKLPIDVSKPQEGQVQPTVAPKPEPAVDNSNPEVMMKVAFGYLKTGHFELAKELLTSVIQLQPGNSTAYQYLGYCHLKLQDLDKAIENYGKAVKLSDNDWEAHRGLGVAYMLKATRDNDQLFKAAAVKQWQISIDINPDQRSSDQLRKLIDKYTK